MCCPSETGDREDMKLRAILDRLDEMESKITDHSLSHVTGLDLHNHSEDHTVHFSEASDMFEGARDRGTHLGTTYITYLYTENWLILLNYSTIQY